MDASVEILEAGTKYERKRQLLGKCRVLKFFKNFQI
jgi:hypothetical protein